MGWFLRDCGQGSVEDFQFSGVHPYWTGRIVVLFTELKTLGWARWDQETEHLELVRSRVWPDKLSFVGPCIVFPFPVMSAQRCYLGL